MTEYLPFVVAAGLLLGLFCAIVIVVNWESIFPRG